MGDDSMIGLRLANTTADYARRRPPAAPAARDREHAQLLTRLAALQAAQHAASARAREHARKAQTADTATQRHWHAGEAQTALARTVALGPQIAGLQTTIAAHRASG